MEAGLRGATDEAQLAYVRRTNRVLVTYDAGFIARHTAGEPHPGIVFYQSQTRTIGEMIAFLALMAEVLSPEDMANRLEYA